MLLFPLASPTQRVTLVSLGLLSALALATLEARAADTLPVSALDTTALGGVVAPAEAEAGALRTSFRLEAASGVFDHESLRSSNKGDAASDALLRDANRGSLFLSGTIGARFDVALGLHGTYEHVRAASRDALFQAASWRENMKQSGFAGASLLAKVKLLGDAGVQLALAPFLESGVGEQATYSLTRSVKPKAGYMAIASYGADGVGAVILNAGGRFRETEEIGGVLLRNEIFYKASVRADLNTSVALFASSEGRRLMVADGGEHGEGNERNYRAQHAAEAGGGLALTLGETRLAAFGAARIRGTNGLGYGAKSYGMSIATSLGNYRGERPRYSAAADVERREAEMAAARKPEKAFVGPPAPIPLKDEYPEMIGDDIDPLTALEGEAKVSDDFRDVDRILKDNETAAKTVSEDEKIAIELRELREAGAKAELEKAKIDASEREERRLKAVEQAKQDDVLEREWMNEAKRDVDEIEGIGADQTEWNGLD